MSLKDDDNIEHFFQKATSKHETEFHEEDWRKMEEMLDKEQERIATIQHKRWLRGGAVGVGILLLTTASYFLLRQDKVAPHDQFTVETERVDDQKSRIRNLEESLIQGDNAAVQNKKANAVLDNKVIEKNSNGLESVTEVDNSQNRFSAKQNNATLGTTEGEMKTAELRNEKFEIIDKNNVTENKVATSNASANDNMMLERSDLAENSVEETFNTAHSFITSQPEGKISTGVTEKNVAAIGKGEQEDVSRGVDPVSYSESEPQKEDVQGENRHAVSREPLKSSRDDVGSLVGGPKSSKGDNNNNLVETLSEDSVEVNEKGKDIEDVVEKVMAEEQQDRNLQPSYRLSVSAIVAPDFSSTGLSDYMAPGTTYGVMVHYKLVNKVTVSTGALKSDKQYWGHGYEYSPPKGYWQARTNGILPNRVDGNCMVLEIPLSLRYDLMEVKKSMLYVAAGVSSYLMLDEYYRYTFDEPNPGAALGWQAREKESFWFSIGTVSFGYERLLSQRLSLGVEPYLKVPFSGVGWPSLNLYSTGAYLTLRYRMLKKGSPSSPP